MPRLRKLSPTEIAALAQPPTPGPRAQVARAYDDYLVSFAIGDHGRVELHEGERRDDVRTRLHAAARRRSLALRFRPGPGAVLIFHVMAALPSVAPALPPGPVARPAPERIPEAQRFSGPAVVARRPPRPRQTATERYHEVLPRWMREDGQGDRRVGSKRRHGR